MINNVILTGRTTKEINLSQSNDGQTSIASFQLAVNRNHRDGGADFIHCKGFNKTAEILSKLEKGTLIGVEGRIQTGSYEKEGKRIYTTDVIISRITFLESKKSFNGNENQHENMIGGDSIPVDDDDLPF